MPVSGSFAPEAAKLWTKPQTSSEKVPAHQRFCRVSGIVLSSSVRQNLLSLQSTASLLATTQHDLATGNKVNSALDNPTEYFTAHGLNHRASDINSLLDGMRKRAANHPVYSRSGTPDSMRVENCAALP
jgi:hypothetical protein